jgi:DNA (cytosine-5)-methyltransferase 1
MQQSDISNSPGPHKMTALAIIPNYRWIGGLIVDNFAGGGGASTGIAQALGRSPDIAVNHNAEALMMHEENHPETQHFNESVWEINIQKATGRAPVLMAWFSPDCTHFSVAKGGKPVKKVIRGLAWIVKKWIGQSDLGILFMENVTEFTTWGPLVAKRCKDTGRVIKLVADLVKKDKNGDPVMNEVVAEPGEYVPYREQALVPDRGKIYGSAANRRKQRRKYAKWGQPLGRTFKLFLWHLQQAGYDVQWRMEGLTAADYGDPTTRNRFFLMARKDGLPIVWPEPTHGDPKSKAVKEGKLHPWKTAGENLDFSIPCPSIFDRKKPLAEKTLARIFKGLEKFVINAGDDAFLVKVNHAYDQFRGQGLDEPLQTITSKLGTGLVDVSMQPVNDLDEALVSAGCITTIDHQSSGDPSQSMDLPLTTVTSKARHIHIAALLKHYTGVVGQALDKPLPTITATDHNSVLEAKAVHIQRDFGNSVGHPADEPLGAITAGGGGKAALVASSLVKLKGTCQHGQSLDEPLGTIQAQGNHYANVQAFLMKYYTTGAIGQSLDEPLHTITSKTRFGLVTFQGQDYQIVDIGMRMLEPHELYRCQGFPADYQHETVKGKKLAKHAQVRMVGNSVPPGLARALVEANVPKWAIAQRLEVAA